MFCYKDRTYCPDEINTSCKKRPICPRVMTEWEKIEVFAKDVPVAYWTGKPDCFEEKE